MMRVHTILLILLAILFCSNAYKISSSSSLSSLLIKYQQCQFINKHYHNNNKQHPLSSSSSSSSSLSRLYSRFIPSPISHDEILPKLKATKTKLELKFNGSSIKYLFNELIQSISILWSFTRPHTIVGSAISVVALFMFATPPEFWLTKSFIMSIIESAIPALLMNIYITGLNQVTDVEIDKINKPYLPIAAGELSLKEGIAIIVASLIGSLYMGWNTAWPLKSTLIGSAFLGTIYSLPPFRLKRFPQLAALCILIVRGSIVNLGFYFQAKCKLIGSDYFYSFFNACKAYPEAILLTTFFAIFGLVIAIMKDVPDIKGDQLFNIPSFSVQLGSKKMFDIAKTILLGLLLSSASSSLVMLGLQYNAISNATKICRVALSSILLVISADLGRKAIKVDTDNSQQIFDYYMHVWVIFYACYLLLPLVR